jgi:hypothetical protein
MICFQFSIKDKVNFTFKNIRIFGFENSHKIMETIIIRHTKGNKLKNN